MKELNKIYPLVTKLMLLWHVFTAFAIFMVTLVFTMAADDTPLRAYLITVGAGAVLTGIPIFGFIRQLQCRLWVHRHCIGWGHGVMYLADRVQDIELLREEVRRLCTQDVVDVVQARLRSHKKLKTTRRPEVVLAIAQTVVIQTDKRRGKSWRVMGLQLGNRIWLTWQSANLRAYRGLLGHELGEMLLSEDGFRGTPAARHTIIRETGLHNLFQVPQDVERYSIPKVEA